MKKVSVSKILCFGVIGIVLIGTLAFWTISVTQQDNSPAVLDVKTFNDPDGLYSISYQQIADTDPNGDQAHVTISLKNKDGEKVDGDWFFLKEHKKLANESDITSVKWKKHSVVVRIKAAPDDEKEIELKYENQPDIY